MDISNIIIVILIILFITISTSLFIISYLRPKAFISLSPNTGPMLNTNIGKPSDVRDNFMVPPSSTLIVYLNYKVNNKTSSIDTSSKPVRILELENSLKIELIPGNNKNPQKTLLTIQTLSENNSITYESFIIKDIPQQKWIHFVLVKEGRRYTIYYNGVAIFSDRTRKYPTINSSQFIIGDDNIVGTFALPKIAPTEYRINEILSDLQITSDTRHKPYLPTDSVIPTFYYPSFGYPSFGCPNGLFCFSTSSEPVQNPLKGWKSPYA